MNADIEKNIRLNIGWSKLSPNIKQNLANTPKEYDKYIIAYSIRNQLRYKGNLIRQIRKDERRYYEDLIKYSREHLMLYPYHLSDVIVKGLRMTPFAYYTYVVGDLMTHEKSYDSLPNFTAADCLRLMGIGRNQYIDIMNMCRSSKKLFRRRPVRELLPKQPIESLVIDSWWLVNTGFIAEEDIRLCSIDEKSVIDLIIDKGTQQAGKLDFNILQNLYRRGLIYLDVPINDDDFIIVPPLEGFVMNRVLGDYFETLLYKIFVSLDEHTNVGELAKILEIDQQLVKNAVSLFCRLGFGRKKFLETNQSGLHSSWSNLEQNNFAVKKPNPDQLLINWTTSILNNNEKNANSNLSIVPDNNSSDDSSSVVGSSFCKRIGLLFDSTLTAFLMMGNLSPGLKSHAVTMFEVGKLNDETLDSFLSELEKIDTFAEGEAQRYFEHAIALRDTILFLRRNAELLGDAGSPNGLGLDLLRYESLLSLDINTCSRILNKNYSLLVSVAPLCCKIRPLSNGVPHHIGPVIPQVNSVWFKLFLYCRTSSGPPSLLLVRGTKLSKFPKCFMEYEKILITTWGHDPAIISTSNVLLTLNDALLHSPILLQGYGWRNNESLTKHIPFPFTKESRKYRVVRQLADCLDLRHTCGYLTLLKSGFPSPILPSSLSLHNCAVATQPYRSEIPFETQSDATPMSQEDSETGVEDADCTEDSDWIVLDCCFGIPLFNAEINREVCQRIAATKLCHGSSLVQLEESNKELSSELINFIQQYQVMSQSQHRSVDTSMSTPHPTQNLLFNDGHIKVWDGR